MKTRSLWRPLSIWVMSLAVWLTGAAPAGSVIGGSADGDRHPYVGAIDARQIGRRLTPSGMLISPTVYLTAGHVTRFWDDVGVRRARVTFDPVVSESSRWHWGTVHTNPNYDPTSADDPGDLGVVVFDGPVTGITPASLPSQGLLDEIGPAGLGGTTFTAVGYGVSRTTGGSDGGGPPALDFTSGGTRKAARLGFVSLTPSWLRLEAHGEGEPCTGDSGSPALFGDSDLVAGVVAIIPAGCGHQRQVSWEQRVDTASSRAFLSQYVMLR